MKRNSWKKLCSVMLCLVMVMGMMPVTALATEAVHTHTYNAGYQYSGDKTHYGVCSCGAVDSENPVQCIYDEKVPAWDRSPGEDSEGKRTWECTLCKGEWQEIVPAHECTVGDWAMEDVIYHSTACTFPGCGGWLGGRHNNHMTGPYHVNATTLRDDCQICEYYRSYEIEATVSAIAAKEATCKNPGNIAFWICDHCHKYFADETCQKELRPADAYVNPLPHNYVDGVCTSCGDQVIRARFAESFDSYFSSMDDYLYVLIGKTADGKVYAMGEALPDGKRAAVEIPAAQIDENGVLTVTSDQAEFMGYTYDSSTHATFTVDGSYMTVLDGRIYVYPAERYDDRANARPFTFSQAEYGDESGLGYIYGNLYNPDNHKHTYEYMTFNQETLCFEPCAQQQNTVYIYRQICEHAAADVTHYNEAPTCVEQGVREYWYCVKCDSYFSDAVCTSLYEFPEDTYNYYEYFTLPALGHSYNEKGICIHCGMKRPVYTQVSNLEAFDSLSEDASYIFVFADGDKTYAACLPIFENPCDIDSNGDGIVDILEPDVNTNGIPDCVEDFINSYWGGADANGDGITTAEEYNEVICDMTEDGVVDTQDYQLFFQRDMYWELSWQYEEQARQKPNFVEVTMAEDGSITITDEGAMELQMMQAGAWGGQMNDEIDPSEYGVTDTDRLRAAWIPNYWVASSGTMGAYGEEHLMMQNRLYGDRDYPGIIDNKNWKISFESDGTAKLVSTWADFDDTAALQLVKYTDAEGNQRMTMVGLYGDQWQYSDIMNNAIVILPAYLYASEPIFDHTHQWSNWEKVDEENHQRSCTAEGCMIKTQTEPHSWDNGVETVAPSCMQTGVKTYTCTDCGATATQSIAALGHDWGDWTDDGENAVAETHTRSCQRVGCGATEQSAHRWSDWVDDGDTTHKKTCAICTGVRFNTHLWDDGVITILPTEEAEGLKTYTCAACAHTKTEIIAKLEHVHSWSDWGQNDAQTHIRSCRCNETQTAPHSFGEGVVTVQPTHTEAGVKTFTCGDCGYSYIEELPKTPEHLWGDWVADAESNTHTRACKCGATETQTHTWSQWTSADGSRYRRECAVCGVTEWMTIEEEKPVNTTPEDNAANGNLTNTDMELIEKLLTDEEQSQMAGGTQVKIYLKVEDISEDVPYEQQTAVEAAAGESKIGMYLDIDLFKQIGEKETQVTETAGTVTITITIPDELVNTDDSVIRTYQIIRIHEDENGNQLIDVIEGVFNPENNSFTFQTDKFSTYALAYTETTSATDKTGDMDADGDVDVDDAVYLLQHVLMPELFQVRQSADMDKKDGVNVNDAIYLLQHVLMPNQFPLT